jgi:hypothetical protein
MFLGKIPGQGVGTSGFPELFARSVTNPPNAITPQKNDFLLFCNGQSCNKKNHIVLIFPDPPSSSKSALPPA